MVVMTPFSNGNEWSPSESLMIPVTWPRLLSP
jgi:hypothetical protein